MILLNKTVRYVRFIEKLFAGDGGGGGGAGGPGGVGAAGDHGADPGNTGSGGNVGSGGSGGNVGPGLATGHGVSGYGSQEEGKPGVFGGGVLGGISPAEAAAAAEAQANAEVGNLAAELGIGHAGQLGQSGMIGSGNLAANAGNVASANEIGLAGLIGQQAVASALANQQGNQAAALGIGHAGLTGQTGLAEQSLLGFSKGLQPGILGAIARGNLGNPEVTNDAFAEMTQNLSFLDKASLAYGFYKGETPGILSSALGILGMPVTSGQLIAALGAAMTGNLVSGNESEVGIDAPGGGPDFMNPNGPNVPATALAQEAPESSDPFSARDYDPLLRTIITRGRTLGDILGDIRVAGNVSGGTQ